MNHKFTLLTPSLFSEVGENNICDKYVDDFALHLLNCSTQDFGMKCYLPTEPGDAFITSFNKFEEKFLKSSEYALLIISQNSVEAIRKFYPRLLVFLSMRPEWSNRFVLLVLGDVEFPKSVDVGILTHAPIQFTKMWHQNPHQNDSSWKKLFSLLKVKWTPHLENCSNLHNHSEEKPSSDSSVNCSENMSQNTIVDDFGTNTDDNGGDEEFVREELKKAGYDNEYIEDKEKIISKSSSPKELLHVQNQGCSLQPQHKKVTAPSSPATLSVAPRDLTDSGAGFLSDSSEGSKGKHSRSPDRHRHKRHGHHESHTDGGRAVQQQSTTTTTTTNFVTEETVILPGSKSQIDDVKTSADSHSPSNVNSGVFSVVHKDNDSSRNIQKPSKEDSISVEGNKVSPARITAIDSVTPKTAAVQYAADNFSTNNSKSAANSSNQIKDVPVVSERDKELETKENAYFSTKNSKSAANSSNQIKDVPVVSERDKELETKENAEGFSISNWFSRLGGNQTKNKADDLSQRSGLETLDDSSGHVYTTSWLTNFMGNSRNPDSLDGSGEKSFEEIQAEGENKGDSFFSWRWNWPKLFGTGNKENDVSGIETEEEKDTNSKGILISLRDLFSWSNLMGGADGLDAIDDRHLRDLPDWSLLYIIVNTGTAYALRHLFYPRLLCGNGSRELPGEDCLKRQVVTFQYHISRIFRKPLCVSLLFAIGTVMAPYYNIYTRYLFATVVLFVEKNVEILPGFPLFPFPPNRIFAYPASGTWTTRSRWLSHERFDGSIILPDSFSYVDEIEYSR